MKIAFNKPYLFKNAELYVANSLNSLKHSGNQHWNKKCIDYLKEKYPDAVFVSSTKGTNIKKLISEITTNVFGNLNEVSLIISPKDLDQLHKYSSIVSVKNIEEGLEVIVEIRNYYLENLLQKDVVKLLS